MEKKEFWRPKAVFTDSKNTLFGWDYVWIDSCRQILEKYGSSMAPIDFWRTWIRVGAGENHKVAFGRYREFKETLQVGLELTFALTGIPGTREDISFMYERWDEVLPYPDVAPGLSRVQKHVPVLIFSNVETWALDLMVDKLEGFRPDFVGDMQKGHCSKPSPRAYRWVLETAGRELGLGLDYPDILYAAGPQWDTQAAMALGMKGVWVRRNQDIPADEAHVGLEIWGEPYDHIVSDFYEVAQIVEKSMVWNPPDLNR
jgi:2-haloalkanoic acid dehalogenase type II